MIRAWWSWSIDAIYFMNDASYALYQDIFESDRAMVPEREAWLWENETAKGMVDCGLQQARDGVLTDGPDLCWDTGAHVDPNRYCVNCGWTNPKLTTLALGVTGDPTEFHG
jgi:hypothetical protein